MAMILHNELEHVNRMYTLLARTTQGHVEMKKILSQFIKNSGKHINEDSVIDRPLTPGSRPSTAKSDVTQTPPTEWVQQMLQLKLKMDQFLEHSLKKDLTFEAVMDHAFRDVLSHAQRAAEFLSLFIDSKLRKSARGVIVLYVSPS
jgi:bacterioferritin (cytochrome b1)